MSLNWIDILMGCILVRCLIIGTIKGARIEIFKFSGTVFATFIVPHYYVLLAENFYKLWAIPTVIGEVFAFGVLWFSVVIIFKIMRDGWSILFKNVPDSIIYKWGGALIAIFRGVMVCSIAFLWIFVAGNKFLVHQARGSLISFYVGDMATLIYDKSFEKVVTRIFPSEKKNNKVFSLKETE